MPILPDVNQTVEKALEILQEVLVEATLAYFTEPYGAATELAGTRMVEVGRLLYDGPYHFIYNSLWEHLGILHPEAAGDDERLTSLVRHEARGLADMVTDKTTWDEFEAAMYGLRETGRGKPHLLV